MIQKIEIEKTGWGETVYALSVTFDWEPSQTSEKNQCEVWKTEKLVS
jgi:hypothetical protein